MAGLFSFFRNLFKKKQNASAKGFVLFEITGTASSFNVTYTPSDKKTYQLPEVKSGWRYSYEGNPGDYFYCAAQANQRNASVAVKAIYHGEVIMEKSASKNYAVVILSGSLPNPAS